MRHLKLSAASVLLALVMLVGFGSAAQANNISSVYMNGWTTTTGLNLTLKDSYGNILSSGAETGAEFSMRVNLSANNFQDVIGYCIDIFQNSQGAGTTNTTYNLYNATTSPTWSNAQQAAAWLLGHYDPSLGNPYSYSMQTTINALQAAIWEVTYDYSASGNYSLTGGKLVYNSLDSTVAALANSYLTALGIAQNNGTVALSGLNWSGALVSSSNQDFIVGNVTGQVPEPGSMLLFGSAAGLLGWLRRRKGQAKPAEAAQA